MEDRYNNRSPEQYGTRGQSASSQQPGANNAEYIGRDKQKQFGTRPGDQYGAQDQFGDLDDQDPYSNLYDDEPEETPGGEGLQDPGDILQGPSEPPVEPKGPGGAKGPNYDEAGTGDGKWG